MILINVFENPGAEWRGKPFWSWNGKLEKSELLHQIDVMKEMGFGGFFMHSRTGLETEYLGDEWFELINACADYAESIGMEAWLYDEDRWPSGLAGGIVSRHPEYRQKAILLEIEPKDEGKDVIAEFTCDLDGTVCTNVESVDGQRGLQVNTPSDSNLGGTLLRFSVVEQGKSGFYNGYTYIDTMNREATEVFLKSTHEKYAAKCGGRLGKSIKGIFTDEPHRGALLDGFSMYRDDGTYCAPYTPTLFDEFEKRFGYDLKEKLPELFLQLDGQRISQVKWHYVELLQQLFLENYAIPCKEWCEEHNLVLTGHILHEDNLTAQTAMSGSVMRYYEQMTAPGVDVLTEGNRNYWIVKQLASAARQTGKKQLLSELYGCTGWQMPFAGHKAVGDWQALLGINLRCHHLSWYTMRGEAKRDYPASILHQSAWYKEYKHVEDYFARFGYMMAQGEPVCDLLVINPVESLWAQVYLGWSEGLGLKDEHLQKLEEHYQQLFMWLFESQVDFDYGDEDMLARLGDVVRGRLVVGCASYSTVIISGMDTIRSSTLKLLDRFVKTGGKVIVAGDAPSQVDAGADSSFKFQVSGFTPVSFTKDAVLSSVPQPEASIDAPDIFGQLRRTDEGLIFAALNVDRDNARKKATVRLKTDLEIEDWNCETGERMPVVAESDAGWKTFSVDFAEGGQKLWVAGGGVLAAQRGRQNTCGTTDQRGLQDAGSAQREQDAWTPVNGPFKYSLSEPNICVLDFASFRMDGGGWQAADEILKVDQKIRDAHGTPRRGEAALQPWFIAQQPVRELCDVELRFSFEIESMLDWVDLVVEEPEKFIISVNGCMLDISHHESWVDVALRRIRISSKLLNVGSNDILLKTHYTENRGLEAIYLLGEFGVKLDGILRSLVRLPSMLEVGDICPQGFPFYSGKVVYQVPVPEHAERLKLSDMGAACAAVSGRILGWAPFEADISGHSDVVEVETVLTRRNTFGPLHDALSTTRTYVHPDLFVTEKDEFVRDCMLVATGLLATPEYT